MKTITIFGKGNMATAIGTNFSKTGHNVSYIGSKDEAIELGDIVVFAVPFAVTAGLAEKYQTELEGKILIDITNPVNFETFDGLVVPSDSSSAEQLSLKLPKTSIIKAFNTNFAATLASGKVDTVATTVLMASDDGEAKKALATELDGSGLTFKDAGSLKRARELEALGFLQISLAGREEITWTHGFALID